MIFEGYQTTSFDELLTGDGRPRPESVAIVEHLERLGVEGLADRQRAAELGIEAAGITFTVYSEGTGIDRAWPFDIVPRVIDRRTWDRVDAGLVQRLAALNRFVDDVYNERTIIAEGIVPESLIANSPGFRPECVGAKPIHGVWAHICGSDLVRGDDGTFYVLEDNLRVPSGVSYMLENREVTKRVFPELFANQSILPVDAYPDRLRRILASLSLRGDDATIAVLTPGIYNSAYFEHSFLARQMGAELVEGRDLVVDDDLRVLMRTIDGPEPVDVIYRRVDDEFLDPAVFRPDSTLGTPGLMEAWRAGTVAIANAPGTGVADDKAVYAYVPDMIRFYLGAEPILANVPTYRCDDDDDRAHVLAHLDELVIKPANESGGYGIVIGPQATSETLAECAAAIAEDPRRFVAQPVVNLSTVPTLVDSGDGGFELGARHVDLRPFTLMGAESYVTCGGLTRVARERWSLVVNSSQGGGSKDTWIVDTDAFVSSTPPATPPSPAPPTDGPSTETPSTSTTDREP